jgi:GNAT superfamily N-acetyltransferase
MDRRHSGVANARESLVWRLRRAVCFPRGQTGEPSEAGSSQRIGRTSARLRTLEAGTVQMSPDYVIALAAPEHLGALGAVEAGAASRFRGWRVPPAMFEEATPLRVFEAAQTAGHLWVAISSVGDCVGFALVEPSGGRLHLEELDVLPEHGGRGLGRALVGEVERWAADRGFGEITLTSYRDVPWNEPFYLRLGYSVVEPDDLDAELVARLAAESARGLDTMPRVAMRKRLALRSSAENGAPPGAGGD